jgi:hypothetical protein
MRSVRGVAAAALVALLFASCAHDAGSIDRAGASLLSAEVDAARQAVSQRDLPRASELLQAVEDIVAGLRKQHKISDTRAAQVLAALGEVQDALRAWVSTTTTTQPPPVTAPPASTPERDGGKRKGHGHGDKGED